MAESETFDIFDETEESPETESPEETEETEEKTVELFNANDGLFGRTGGPYLDVEEAKVFERDAAAREGVEPDLENPRPYPGIVLRTKGAQVDNFNPLITAGDDLKDQSEFTAPVATTVVQAVPVDTETE